MGVVVDIPNLPGIFNEIESNKCIASPEQRHCLAQSCVLEAHHRGKGYQSRALAALSFEWASANMHIDMIMGWHWIHADYIDVVCLVHVVLVLTWQYCWHPSICYRQKECSKQLNVCVQVCLRCLFGDKFLRCKEGRCCA